MHLQASELFFIKPLSMALTTAYEWVPQIIAIGGTENVPPLTLFVQMHSCCDDLCFYYRTIPIITGIEYECLMLSTGEKNRTTL